MFGRFLNACHMRILEVKMALGALQLFVFMAPRCWHRLKGAGWDVLRLVTEDTDSSLESQGYISGKGGSVAETLCCGKPATHYVNLDTGGLHTVVYMLCKDHAEWAKSDVRVTCEVRELPDSARHTCTLVHFSKLFRAEGGQLWLG